MARLFLGKSQLPGNQWRVTGTGQEIVGQITTHKTANYQVTKLALEVLVGQILLLLDGANQEVFLFPVFILSQASVEDCTWVLCGMLGVRGPMVM